MEPQKERKMNITTSKVDSIFIEGMPVLDPVRVYFENYELGQGRITITCYGRAWTCAWFSMGERTIQQFFASCNHDYLLQNLCIQITTKKLQKTEDKYLMRIINAVEIAINGLLSNADGIKNIDLDAP